MLSLEEKQIFTSSLAAITQLANGHHKLFCFGGEYSPDDMAFRNSGSEIYPDIQFDLCFFGSSGVKNRKGFCTSSLIDAEAKRRMLKNLLKQSFCLITQSLKRPPSFKFLLGLKSISLSQIKSSH